MTPDASLIRALLGDYLLARTLLLAAYPAVTPDYQVSNAEVAALIARLAP